MKNKIDLRILTKSLTFVLKHEISSKFLKDRNKHSKTTIQDIHSKVIGEKDGIVYIQHRFNFELINEFVVANEDLLVGIQFNRNNKSFKLLEAEPRG